MLFWVPLKVPGGLLVWRGRLYIYSWILGLIMGGLFFKNRWDIIINFGNLCAEDLLTTVVG